MEPVFGGKPRADGRPVRVSFLQLAEIIVVARFRHLGVRLQRLRAAHRFAREAFGLPYPFASLKLTSAGGHVLHSFDERFPGQMLALDTGGRQWTLPGIVTRELERFEYEGDPWVLRWFPEGRACPIVIDPHVSGGLPTIAKTGVSVTIVQKRFTAGESIDDIANDFELARADIEVALRYAAKAA